MKHRSYLIIVALLLTLLCLNGASAEAEASQSGDAPVSQALGKAVSFSIYNGTLMGYTGSASSLIIPETVDGQQVTGIGAYVFRNAEFISVTLPSTLTSIGNRAFTGCTQLETVNGLENTKVTAIDEYAFSGCGALQTIGFPPTLASLGEAAFMNCTQLAAVNGLENTKLKDMARAAFYGCAALKEISLPSTLTYLDAYAFYGCSRLAAVNGLENTRVTRLGEKAFKSCTALKKISLPDTLTSIGPEALSDSSLLKKLYLPAVLTDIGSGAFPAQMVLYVGGNKAALAYARLCGYPYTSDDEVAMSGYFRTADEKAHWIVDHYIDETMGEYERALALYNWLCLNVRYYYAGDGMVAAHGSGLKGALLDGYAICDGFAAAYKLLLQYAGIEAYYVTGRANGGAHAWNLARIDGKWYQFDATWDEDGNGRTHDYFGLTDAEMRMSHRQDSYTWIVCDALDANYNYRNGAYAEQLAAALAEIEAALLRGETEFDVSVELHTNPPAALAVIAAALNRKSNWSVSGWTETSCVDQKIHVILHSGTSAESIEIDGAAENVSYAMLIGSSVALTATVKPSGTPLWSSSDTGVCTIDSKSGQATAVATGDAVLTASCGSCSTSVYVSVRALNDMPETFVVCNQSYLDAGEQAVLTLTGEQLLKGNLKVEYSSSNPEVATVNAQGVVTAVSYGWTNINCSIQDGTNREQKVFLMVRAPVTRLYFEKSVYETTTNAGQQVLYARLECVDAEASHKLYWPNAYAYFLSGRHEGSLSYASGSPERYGFYFTPAEPGMWEVSVEATDGSGTTGFCQVLVHSTSPLKLPSGLKQIGAEAFAGAACEEAILPDGVTQIGARAFADCARLVLVRVPASVKTIADDAFEGCTRLTLYGKAGSRAESYASENGYYFVPVS